MRSTRDCVEELITAATHLTAVGIVVGFEQKTKFVWHRPFNQANSSLEELNVLVREGGAPIGLVGYLNMPGEIRLYQKVFTEYARDAWVDEYFASLMEQFQLLAKERGAKLVKPHPEEN